MDTTFLVSARKYRPRRFDELVAQDHVTETLRNAIRLDRLAHAYLFSGPRGVGKTTAARILAKAINCSTPLDERPDAEPCLECDSCRSFAGNRNLNVIEIDAASNNKVEHMRDLRDTVRIPPQGAPHKVYIIDEVHMLSQSAFNALLKTLEEPPAYALFIFATTEPHKVLPTIQSRCQRFDFRRIDVEVIVSHLRHIAAQEGVSGDEAAFMLLARKGDGALRDALSAFDQAVSLCGRDISYDELAHAFRVVDEDRYFDVTRSAAARDSAAVLKTVDDLVVEGYDLTEFLAGLLGHLRNLFVAVSMGSTDLIEATGAVRDRYRESAAQFSEADLLRMMMIVSTTEESLRASRQPRLNAELGLLKLVHMNRATDLTELVRALKSADATRSPKPNPDAGKPPAKSVRSSPPEKDPERSSAETGREPAETRREPAETGREPAETGREPVETGTASSEPEPAVSAPSLFGSPALRASERVRKSDSTVSTEGSAAVSLDRSGTPDRSALKEIDGIWLAFVRSVKSDRIHVGSLLQHGSPSGLSGTTLQIAIPDDFHRRLLTNQADFLLGHLESHLPGGKVRNLAFRIRDDLPQDQAETDDSFDPFEYMERKRAESPVVRAIFEEFGGELVW